VFPNGQITDRGEGDTNFTPHLSRNGITNPKPVPSGVIPRIWTGLTVFVTSPSSQPFGDGGLPFRTILQHVWTCAIKEFNEVNHPPAPKLTHTNEINIKSGEKVTLDASLTSDPDTKG
jgi:hypothetical protein